jgi:hypothetical protein
VGLADKWARHGSEREKWMECFLTRNLKTEIGKKKRTFLEKSFSMQIKKRKIYGISTKITLSDYNFLNHLISGFDK